MGSFLYFAIIALQFSNSLATEPIPLKCFLQNYSFLNTFGSNPVSSAKSNSLQFETVEANSVSFDKNDWVHKASNVKYQGLDNAILDDFGMNFVTNVAHFTFHTDLELTYSYITNGNLFSKPINGEGLAKVSLKNAQFGLSIPFDIKEVNGNKFINLRNFNSWYNIRDKANFDFDNLYYGNKELCDSMHQLLNINWKFITDEFGKVFMDKVTESAFNKLKNYMLTMPLKDFATC